MIAYEFDLTGKAEGKQQEVASAIKSWIERNYGLKFVHKVDEDWGYQYDIASGKDFTYVVYLSDDEEGNAFLDFFVAFDKQQLLNRFASYFQVISRQIKPLKKVAPAATFFMIYSVVGV